MRCRAVVVAAVAAAVLAACPLPVPPLGVPAGSRDNLPDRVPSFIVDGTTTREDVLLGLGTPDAQSPDGRWFAYRSERHTGGVIFVVGGGYRAGGAGIVGYRERRLMVRFDERNVVADATLEERVCPRGVVGLDGAGSASAPCLAVPELADGPSADLLGLMRLHVASNDGDLRRIDRLIAAELRRNGLDATVGPLSDAPANVDAVVSYQDLPGAAATESIDELTIVVQRPGAPKILALATSRQTSAAERTPAAMVEEAVTAVFAGPGKPFVTLPAWAPAPPAAADAGPPADRVAVRLEPVRDARLAPRGKFIGERTALGVSLGVIDMAPMPVKAVGQLLHAELARAGHRVDGADAAVVVDAQLTRFDVRTPSTLTYWDVEGAIALDLGVTRSAVPRKALHYEATCSERTYRMLNEAIVRGVVAACMARIGAQVRQDIALGRLLAVP